MFIGVVSLHAHTHIIIIFLSNKTFFFHIEVGTSLLQSAQTWKICICYMITSTRNVASELLVGYYPCVENYTTHSFKQSIELSIKTLKEGRDCGFDPSLRQLYVKCSL